MRNVYDFPSSTPQLSSLIEIAGVEEGKAEVGEKKEVCEEEEHASRGESSPRGRWFLAPLGLCPTEKQRFSRTCLSAGQASEKASR
jgi:hypothetical protein